MNTLLTDYVIGSNSHNLAHVITLHLLSRFFPWWLIVRVQKFWLPIIDGLTNVVVYNRCAATWHFSSRAAFKFITSVGISAPMMTIMHSYMKADRAHYFHKHGVVQGWQIWVQCNAYEKYILFLLHAVTACAIFWWWHLSCNTFFFLFIHRNARWRHLLVIKPQRSLSFNLSHVVQYLEIMLTLYCSTFTCILLCCTWHYGTVVLIGGIKLDYVFVGVCAISNTKICRK